MKKCLVNVFSVFISLVAFGQGETGSQDFFKSNLKIYVVVAVLTIILGCIFAFLFSLERRLRDLENKK